MRTTPELLAAIAAAAVPGIAPVATGPSPDDHADFDSCLVLDARKQFWRVRRPRTAEAGVRLETEHLALRAFTPSVRTHLPVHLPTVVGSVEHKGLRTFVYLHQPGSTLSLDELSRQNDHPAPGARPTAPSAEPRAPLAVQVGRAVAAVHSLPRALVMDADLPAYSADQCRVRMLHDLDRAAATGRVPGQLLSRWERALENTDLWRYSTRVVHGDLNERNVTVHEGAIASITGWSDLHVGDPAVDFAWLTDMTHPGFADAALAAYSHAAVQEPDPHLLERAHLHGEFALAEWLVRCVDQGPAASIKDAEGMLATLAQDVEHSGSPSPGVIPENPAEQPVPTDPVRPGTGAATTPVPDADRPTAR